MMTLYQFELSGNSHKVRLMLSLLGLASQSIIPTKGEHKSLEFIKLHPLGQVPVLVDGDVVIYDSHAILVYLARRYGGENWLPSDPVLMGKVIQWLSFAANEIHQSFEIARRYYLFNADIDVKAAQKKAHTLAGVIDAHLAHRQWLECDRPTIADIACFPYIGLAADAHVSLDGYSHVIAWIDRIKQLPGYIGMPGL